jgi:hypothetical protein
MEHIILKKTIDKCPDIFMKCLENKCDKNLKCMDIYKKCVEKKDTK